jgi:hypothetical protein
MSRSHDLHVLHIPANEHVLEKLQPQSGRCSPVWRLNPMEGVVSALKGSGPHFTPGKFSTRSTRQTAGLVSRRGTHVHFGRVTVRIRCCGSAVPHSSRASTPRLRLALGFASFPANPCRRRQVGADSSATQDPPDRLIWALGQCFDSLLRWLRSHEQTRHAHGHLAGGGVDPAVCLFSNASKSRRCCLFSAPPWALFAREAIILQLVQLPWPGRSRIESYVFTRERMLGGVSCGCTA